MCETIKKKRKKEINTLSNKQKYRVHCLCTCAQSLQSCPALCNPGDCSLPGSSGHRIFPARTLEWAAMPSSRGSSRPKDRTCISCVSHTASGFFTTEQQGKFRSSDTTYSITISRFQCKEISLKDVF